MAGPLGGNDISQTGTGGGLPAGQNPNPTQDVGGGLGAGGNTLAQYYTGEGGL